jgi:glycosyltransferase involved in cell wall biosynthesis
VARPSPLPPLRRRVKQLLRTGRWPASGTVSPFYRDKLFTRLTLDRVRLPTDADVPDADVLVTTWFETAEWAQQLSPSKGRRVAFTQGYEVFEPMPVDRINAAWRLPEPMIVVSAWLKEVAEQRFGRQDVFLVPNSVDRAVFYGEQRERTDRPTVGFLAHQMAAKGTARCLEAATRLSGLFPNLQMLTFGHGDYAPPLPPGTTHAHLSHPNPDAIRGTYASCDLWLYASESDGFGLTPLEALVCGTPVVSTAVGALPELVQEGVNGYLVPVGDADALAERAAAVLCAAPADWKRMSDAARNTQRGYSWDEASRRFEGALRNIVGGAG